MNNLLDGLKEKNNSLENITWSVKGIIVFSAAVFARRDWSI